MPSFIQYPDLAYFLRINATSFETTWRIMIALQMIVWEIVDPIETLEYLANNDDDGLLNWHREALEHQLHMINPNQIMGLDAIDHFGMQQLIELTRASADYIRQPNDPATWRYSRAMTWLIRSAIAGDDSGGLRELFAGCLDGTESGNMSGHFADGSDVSPPSSPRGQELELALDVELEPVGPRSNITAYSAPLLAPRVDTLCTICQARYDSEDDPDDDRPWITTSVCGHEFHGECFDKHINTVNACVSFITCPSCRHPICPRRPGRPVDVEHNVLLLGSDHGHPLELN